MPRKHEIRITADGSATIYLPEWDESYHSHHGAVQEALHVFLEAGLAQFDPATPINILEIGFGTGLNAYLTAKEALLSKRNIRYFGLEAYPVAAHEVSQLNYVTDPAHQALFDALHQAAWDQDVKINESFTLHKIQSKLRDFTLPSSSIDLIYFDAFGPRVQPEMWSEAVFRKMAALQKNGGLLVTYCSKGDVRRAMMAAGYTVSKLPGPPGKREMVRGRKDI